MCIRDREWPIRVNVNHILGDEENLERIPAKIRKVKNLPLLFETEGRPGSEERAEKKDKKNPQQMCCG